MTAPRCLITQPMHPAARERLEAAGFAVREAFADPFEDLAAVDAVITRDLGFPQEAILAAPKLKVIASHGVGYDAVDVASATLQGVCVTNTPGANSQAVAEHTVALLLALAKQVCPADAATRRGDFDFKFSASLIDLAGKTAGLLGWGAIAKRVARILHGGFGMRVLAYTRSKAPGSRGEHGTHFVRLEPLLQQSDVVSLHLPATPDTLGLIGADELKLMKPSALLLNTARGALVDEAALIAALQKRQLQGAGLDVFAQETLPSGHPLLALDNAVLSPHIAGSSPHALERTATMAAEQVIMVLEGRKPTHLVNPAVWPQ